MLRQGLMQSRLAKILYVVEEDLELPEWWDYSVSPAMSSFPSAVD